MMEIDDTLAKEIKALGGDGSREAKFALLKKLDAARADLSTTKIRETFNSALKKHGRAVVAICVAVTLDARRDRLDHWEWHWALSVIALLPCSFTRNNYMRAYIDDGIHPTAICDYARELIRATSVEANARL